MTSATATVMPRLHQVNPTQADRPTASSTPATTLATLVTALRSVWYRLTWTTSSAVSGASTGRGVLVSTSASRYAKTAVQVSRTMVTAVGCARCRTTVSVCGRALGDGARRGTQLLAPAPAEEHGPLHHCPSTATVPGRPTARHPPFS